MDFSQIIRGTSRRQQTPRKPNLEPAPLWHGAQAEHQEAGAFCGLSNTSNAHHLDAQTLERLQGRGAVSSKKTGKDEPRGFSAGPLSWGATTLSCSLLNATLGNKLSRTAENPLEKETQIRFLLNAKAEVRPAVLGRAGVDMYKMTLFLLRSLLD